MKITVLSLSLCWLVSIAVGQYDHLTITVDSLASELAPLCLRVEQAGYRDTVVAVDDIVASSPGRDTQEKIRNYIKDAYANWSVTHVLLAGDHDQIPCRYCWVDVSPEWRDWIPTELYYSALDGDWDRDGDGRFGEPEDSVDLMPDVLLGRLPLATPTEMATFVDRYLEYTGDSTKPYLEDVLLAGFDYSPTFCGEVACELYDTLLRPASMRSHKVYDSHSGNHEDSVKQYLDQGMHIWVQYDHCNYNVMGCGYTNHGWLMWTWELDDMTNAPDYSINLAAGCLPSAFDSSFCVAEVLLTAPNGGCVATFGNTRTGFGAGPDPLRSGSHYYCEKCLEEFWTGPGSGSFAGLVTGQVSAAPLAAGDVVWRWCHYEFLLSGEPAMPVWVPSGSGAGEERGIGPRVARPPVGATVAGRVLTLRGGEPAVLLDRAGRRVADLLPGENDVARLPSGVYFVRGQDSGVPGSEGPRVQKVVIPR